METKGRVPSAKEARVGTGTFPWVRCQKSPMSRERSKDGWQMQWWVPGSWAEAAERIHHPSGKLRCERGSEEAASKTKMWRKITRRVKRPQSAFMYKSRAHLQLKKNKQKCWKVENTDGREKWGVRAGVGQKTGAKTFRTKWLLFYNHVWSLWEKKIWKIPYKMLKVIFLWEKELVMTHAFFFKL